MRRFLSGLLNGTVALGLIGVGMMLANKPASYIDLGSSYFDPFPRGAMAAQGSLCMPTTGTVSGLTFSQNVNTALAALVTSNSGTVSPTNDCSGLAVKGQQWLDTSVTPNLMKAYDGAQWLTIAAFDATGHTWQPRAGDGTLAAPGLAFQSEPATGFRRAGTNDVRLTIAGVDIMQFNASGATLLTGTFNAVPVGTVVDYCGTTEPTGWLFAFGQTLDRTTYAPLFAAYGTNFGAPSGSTFSAPDMRGRVIAGRDNMGGTAASRLTASYFGSSANTLGAGGGAENLTLTQAHLPAVGLSGSGGGSIAGTGSGTFSGSGTGTANGQTFNDFITSTTASSNLSTAAPLNGSWNQPTASTTTPNSTSSSAVSVSVSGSVAVSSLSGTATVTITTANMGSSSAHRTVQPTIVCNKIMKI